jgi:hypothetical protein
MKDVKYQEGFIDPEKILNPHCDPRQCGPTAVDGRLQAAHLSGAFCRSTEPSGSSGRALVIRTSRSLSSIHVRRISSIIVSTRIVACIVFDRANRGLLAEAPCDGGGGCIACDRNEEKECFSTCGQPQKYLYPWDNLAKTSLR